MSKTTFITSAFLAVLVSNTSALAAEPSKGVSTQLKVMASPEITYQALRGMREEDPSGCKVLSSNDSESVVEEEFDGLPVIGKAICVYKETYEPAKKVSFKMLHSDKLKAFEGEWTLEPVDNGAHTILRLRSYIETGLKLPFCKQLTDIANTGEIKQQIADVKKSAEDKQKKIASRNLSSKI